jgi:hypothetical protein
VPTGSACSTLLHYYSHSFRIIWCINGKCRANTFIHWWLRHNATSWKVTGSRPYEVILFLIYLILLATLDPEVHSVSNKNEYQKQENNVSGEQSEAGA